MAAPKTVLTYPLNGANKDFTIPFEYLARKFVSVTLIGKTRQTLTLNSDYRFTTRTTITTTKAWGPANAFESIEIRRVTSATERLVDFADGSILRAYDLNTSQVQSLHIAEEARDLTADTIAVNNDGDLDARGKRLVNLADGVGEGDSVTVRQQKAWAESALNQADRAKREADLALTRQQGATTQASAAYTSAANSGASATKAETQANGSNAAAIRSAASAASAETQANGSNAAAIRSAASASDALISQKAAKSSQDAASVAEQNAREWAGTVNLPPASGQGGKILQQRSDATGFQYIEGPQVTPLDATANRLLRVGAFGGPATADYVHFECQSGIEPATFDCNNAKRGGMWHYIIPRDCVNGPGRVLNDRWFYLETRTVGTAGNALLQLAWPYGEPAGIGKIAYRGFNGNWTGWSTVATVAELTAAIARIATLEARPSFKRWVSGVITPPIGAGPINSHGLGVIPHSMRVIATLTVALSGWPVGTSFEVGIDTNGTSSVTYGLQVLNVTATTFGVCGGNYGLLMFSTTGAAVGVSASQYTLRFEFSAWT